MDTARYIIAVLVWVALPPAITYWLMIHPFAERWRRIGAARTITIVSVAFMLFVVGLFLIRDQVLVREFGTHWTLWVSAALIYAIAIFIEWRCRRELKLRTLVGIPELQANQSERTLLNRGIYTRVRHPRYVGIAVGTLAMTVFANYLATWIMLPFVIVALCGIAVLEERELVRSLGSTYEAYRQQVPMFLPKFGKRPQA